MLKAAFQDRVIDVKRISKGTVVFYSPSSNTMCSDDWEIFYVDLIKRGGHTFIVGVTNASTGEFKLMATNLLIWGE